MTSATPSSVTSRNPHDESRTADGPGVEVISSVTDRIQQIQSQIAQLSAPAAPATADTVIGVVERSTAFDATLGQQMAALGANGTSASAAWALDPTQRAGLAGVSGVGGVGAAAVGSGKSLVNAKGVPVELVHHGNGKVPAEALSPIAGVDGHRLWAPAARSFEALRAAAARDGVQIGVTDSYRPYEVQVDLVRRKGLYSQGGLAATPGTSNHGWGIALDLRLDGEAQAWMRENAGRFGYVEDVPREPWHWTYRPTH